MGFVLEGLRKGTAAFKKNNLPEILLEMRNLAYVYVRVKKYLVDRKLELETDIIKLIVELIDDKDTKRHKN